MSRVLVVDAERRPLMPTTPARARLLLRQKKAATLRRFPLVLILKDALPDAVVEPLRVKLDPGGSTVSGIAVVNDRTGEVVWAAEVTHRSQEIHEAIQRRAAIRRSRRQRHTRYRQVRWRNRRRPKGWLAPSLLSRVLHLVTWVRRLSHWCLVGAISQELVRFDMVALQQPEIQGIEYQRGTLFEAEVKGYLLTEWQYRCAYCAATDTRLEIDHVYPRASGGSNRLSNLVIACRACNEAKANQPIEKFLAERPDLLAHIQVQLKPPLAGAAAVNSTRFRLYEELKAFGLPAELGTGGRTRWNRSRMGLPKLHWIDAALVGASTPQSLRLQHIRPWSAKATGWQRRQMCPMNGAGFPRTRAKQRSRVKGFRTGDLVRAAVPKGKKAGAYRGRVAVRASGSFNITTSQGTIEGIAARCCTRLQQRDGFQYFQRKEAAFPPIT